MTYDCEALVDSGAEVICFTTGLTHSLYGCVKWPVLTLRLTHATASLKRITSGQHSENIDFLLTDNSRCSCSTGTPLARAP